MSSHPYRPVDVKHMFPVIRLLILDRCVESRRGCMYSCRASHQTCSAGQSANWPNKLISGKARILATQPIVIYLACFVGFEDCPF